jgi:hypothetical protein
MNIKLIDADEVRQLLKMTEYNLKKHYHGDDDYCRGKVQAYENVLELMKDVRDNNEQVN